MLNLLKTTDVGFGNVQVSWRRDPFSSVASRLVALGAPEGDGHLVLSMDRRHGESMENASFAYTFSQMSQLSGQHLPLLEEICTISEESEGSDC